MDEHSPHIHAHKVPIDPNGKLNCKHYFGTRSLCSKWQDRFASEVKDLALERGLEGSRARHETIKDFYKAIEREHKFEINYQRLPDPPRMCVTKESGQKFKEEFAQAIIEQIQEPLRTERHQAMLARDAHAKAKETQERLLKAQKQLAEEKEKVKQLTTEKEQVRHHNVTLLQRVDKAEARVRDIDLNQMLRMMGYRGFAEPERRQMTYMKPEKGVIVNVSQGIVYDHNNNLVARSALALVM